MSDRTVQGDSQPTADEASAMVGVIGVGNIGKPILRQVAAPFETIAFDCDADRLVAVLVDGVDAADGTREVGEQADIVLLLAALEVRPSRRPSSATTVCLLASQCRTFSLTRVRSTLT